MLEHLSLSWRVAMRHVAIFRKDLFANILPTIVDPALYLLVFGMWIGAAMGNLGGRSYAEFMAPGIAALTVLFGAFFESSYGFYVRLTFENIFKALMTTPVGPNEIISGEFIWVGLKGTVMGTLVALVLTALGVVHWEYLWLVPFISGLLSMVCGGIGLVSVGYVRNINQFQTVYALLISPMFFVSGVFYPVEQLPRFVQAVCWLSPFFHGVKVLQATLWAENVWTTLFLHGSVLIAMTALLMFWCWRKIYPKLYS